MTREQLEEAIAVTANMGQAAAKLGLGFRQFRDLATKFGLYRVKKSSGQGKKKQLDDILNGRHPEYATAKLSIRLVKEGLKQYRCEKCGLSEWNGSRLSLELNHVNGVSTDHRLVNLELLCPNCHSQTETYRSKKLKWKRKAERPATDFERQVPLRGLGSTPASSAK